METPHSDTTAEKRQKKQARMEISIHFMSVCVLSLMCTLDGLSNIKQA